MKIRLRICAGSFLLGAFFALLAQTKNVVLLLTKPWTALGDTLRAWSLSGSWGNLCAWAAVVLLSLSPSAWMLIARRKRREKGDFLWVLASLSAFPALFFLINPTYLSVPFPRVACMAPTLTTLSLLAAAVITRWASGLRDSEAPARMTALLAVSMALVALSTGWTLTESILPFCRLDMDAARSASLYSAASALIFTLLSLVPNIFTLRTLETAAELAEALRAEWFSEDVGRRAELLARRACHTLIAAVCCAAAKNVASLLLSGILDGTGASISLDLPIYQMLLSCGAMLLAQWLAAACKLKRDNDLMI